MMNITSLATILSKHMNQPKKKWRRREKDAAIFAFYWSNSNANPAFFKGWKPCHLRVLDWHLLFFGRGNLSSYATRSTNQSVQIAIFPSHLHLPPQRDSCKSTSICDIELMIDLRRYEQKEGQEIQIISRQTIYWPLLKAWINSCARLNMHTIVATGS